MKNQRSAHFQLGVLQREQVKCQSVINNSSSIINGVHCPPVWDQIFCWPLTSAGQLSVVPCPSYVEGFDSANQATKYCTSSATWWVHEETNRSWSNYTQCRKRHPLETVPTLNSTLFESHLPAIKSISKFGYIFSLSSLLIASIILASIRKLRCHRNNLHLQLFLSFILRAFMFLLKDALLVEGLAPKLHFDEQQLDLPEMIDLSGTLDCKIFTTAWHYSLMANYSWILMEGLYLHNLVFLAMLRDTSSIVLYVLMGWGFPIIFLTPWILVRATLEDTFCWTTNIHSGYFWIIRGPITASILINFFMFLNITRVLLLKMFLPQAPQAKRYKYRKWFKSTLVLVPLFGVHYAILLCVSFVANFHEMIELVWLYIDQLFSSFQGFLVALLYCFLNGEVRGEVWKIWKKCRTEVDKTHSHTSLFTQSVTYLSRGRGSLHSLHSNSERQEHWQPSTPSPQLSKSSAGGRSAGSHFTDSKTALVISQEEEQSPRHHLWTSSPRFKMHIRKKEVVLELKESSSGIITTKTAEKSDGSLL